MRNVLAIIASVVLLFSTGCSMNNGGWGGKTIDDFAPVIANVTATGARLAFLQDSVKPYRDQICDAVEQIAPLLENYNDPQATFESVRQETHRYIQELPPDILPEDAKEITLAIMDSILDTAFMYAEGHYRDLIDKNEAHVALEIARAVARGLNRACN